MRMRILPYPLADSTQLDFWEIVSGTLVKKYGHVSLVQGDNFLFLLISYGLLCQNFIPIDCFEISVLFHRVAILVVGKRVLQA